MFRACAVAVGVSALLLGLSWTLMTDWAHLRPADFLSDAWFLDHQASSLREDHLPSLFLHADVGVFYPVFAFYGGTLFAAGGALTLVVGSATTAEVIMYVLAMASAYGGWLWLARLAGVRSWMAHAPAIAYATAPYVVTDIYVREDLSETVATAAIPPLIASAVSILRSERLRAGPAAVLAGSTIMLGGAHNLTLLWAGTFGLLIGGLVAVAVPRARRLVTRKGLLRLFAVTTPAMAVDAWYLLPDIAYHSDTVIAQRTDEWRALLSASSEMVNSHHLFSLGRATTAGGLGPSTALPLLVMVWLAIATITTRRQWPTAWGRLNAILLSGTILLVAAMTHPWALRELPDPWVMLQYTYRLETYILFGVCGAMIAVLALLGDTRRRLVVLLVPILALSVVQAFIQVHAAPINPEARRAPDIDSHQTFSIGDFGDSSLPARPTKAGERANLLAFTGDDVNKDRISTTLALQAGDLIYTSVMTPSRLVNVQGAHVVGRWPAPAPHAIWQPRWSLVLQVDDDARPGKAHIVIKQASTLPIVGGRIISLLGLLGLLGVFGTIARGAWRRRRAD